MAEVLVAVERVQRWIDNFAGRHGGVELAVGDDALRGTAPDGSSFVARLPFDRSYAGAADPAAFAEAAAPPPDWGVLLVRRGGFAVARLRGGEVVASKVGKRHVQGRTKAGGWSQQRFARRRDNQARVALAAADEHAARILDGLAGPLVYGGIEEACPEGALLLGGHIADPRRDVLDKAVADAQAARVEVLNAE
ncbi:acVLRF1 family peptidyl-tRNA hydrolase [Nocardioides sp. BP30]|uniref:acVLRF1 family peptidyl-tRNA hydrolase n=1 Tax=Nocardioides sp. BP30 TaxID=3036374 RepID=UPI002468F55F|nr:acVLRF1 family peptidyl-tRNA hydrolase [Nocardioides sp. BP30]WGL50877.1 acVLRF1 family peptidyl-tRNA hydrolase [Nocardioides sp. BP30]